ncbi:MAG: DUF4402 domain-containing protein [Endomicrobia bacterium]|nr:DUF4402 domain-containing protein [Endomicrobiia bacterium]
MKTILRKVCSFAAAIMLTAFTAQGLFAGSDIASVDTRVNIVEQVSINGDTPLHFGSWYSPTANVTISVDLTGAATASNTSVIDEVGSTITGYEAPSAAQFSINGDKNQPVDVTITALGSGYTYNLGAFPNEMPVSNFISNLDGYTAGDGSSATPTADPTEWSIVLDDSGQFFITIGADIEINASQPADSYTDSNDGKNPANLYVMVSW